MYQAFYRRTRLPILTLQKHIHTSETVSTDQATHIIGLSNRRIGFDLCVCHVYNLGIFLFFSRDNMVYWEFLVAGQFEFTQFDPVVAEKHSGLQGFKWEGNSIKCVENELDWIKSLAKSDIIGIRYRISESDIIAIGRRFRNQIGYRTCCTKNS